MRLITKNIYYAIRSLLYIAQEPDIVVSVSQLVNKLNMRRAFLRKILQVLSKHKMLRSIKGKNGGFVLNINPSKLYIIDILNIFKEKVNIMDCLLEKNVCPHPEDCILMAEIKGIEKKLYKMLGTITISKLLNNIKGSKK